jgi:hypothetical protein
MPDDKNQHAAELAKLGASKGGKARAEKLTAEERSEIAQKAAQARWSAEVPEDEVVKASHMGVLELGNAELPCAVLEGGTRVISERGVMAALGRKRGGQRPGGENLPRYLGPSNLNPFISSELMVGINSPVYYRHSKGGGVALGIEASLLPQVLEVWLQARDAGALLATQTHMAARADVLMRALAKVGIIALVDEATGYQEVRDRKALQAILDKYLRAEFAAWAKRFPDEFYKEIFRLRGWPWRGMSVNRPQAVAHYTRDIVYERLAPGILEELEAKNPSDGKGRRKTKHHQWLTEDIGHPALAQHLHAAIGLMRVSRDWDMFMAFLDIAYPKKGQNLSLPIGVTNPRV